MKTLLSTFGLCALLSLSMPAASAAAASVGGYQPISETIPEVQGALYYALFTLNTQEGNEAPYRLLKLVSSESQVVAGVNYRFVLELEHAQKCEIHEVVVFHQAWTGTWQLISDKTL